jgi:hypothetical protein
MWPSENILHLNLNKSQNDSFPSFWANGSFEGKLFLGVIMGKRKIKEVLDKQKSEQKKALRIPNAPPTEFFRDKTKYKRREKYKREYENL